MKVFIEYQKNILPQFEGFSKFLQKREGYKIRTASFFAKQMQDFTQSGMTPKGYFEMIRARDERAAETFLMNFRHYAQFTTSQYFESLHDIRWELGRKHNRRSF